MSSLLMENTLTLFGNDKTCSYFRSAEKTGKLSHAYLFEGPKGSGKKKLATFVCALLACNGEGEKPCGICERCRSVMAGTCPDIRFLVREDDKKTIGVEAVRSFFSSVYLTPTVLDFKAYIIDDADLLTVQSQNALLKVIEEPPENTYIFLLTAAADSLLPTVRSRVMPISTELFSAEQIETFLSHTPYGKEDPDILSFAVNNCFGSIGKAIELLTEKTLDREASELAGKIIRFQCFRNEAGSYYDFLQLCSTSVTTRELLQKSCECLKRAYTDIIAYCLKESDSPSFLKAEEMQSISSRLPLSSVLLSADAVTKVQNDQIFNVNLSLCTLNLAASLWNI